MRVKPPYEGAEDYVLSPHPTFHIGKGGGPYRFNPPDGANTIALIDNEWISAGPAIRFRSARDDKHETEFVGLNPVGKAIEPGVFVELWPKPWLRSRLELRHGVSGHHGAVADAGLDLVYTGKRWDASIGPRIGFGDANYMSTYFGVTPAEAAASPYIDRVYAPSGGLRYTGLSAAGAYRFGGRWRATVDLGYDRLASKPLASPVVESLGAGHQLTLGLGLSYRFGALR